MEIIIMKKAGKRILVAGVTLSIICGIGGAVFAASKPPKSLKATINGYSVSCSSTICEGSGTGYTSYGGSGAVSVSSKLVASHKQTRREKTLNGTKGNYGTASVTVYAPKYYESKKIDTTHTVFAPNQTWKGNTHNGTWLDQ